MRSDLKKSKALEWLVDHVELVDPDGRPVDRTLLTPEAIAATAPEALGEPAPEALGSQRRKRRARPILVACRSP